MDNLKYVNLISTSITFHEYSAFANRKSWLMSALISPSKYTFVNILKMNAMHFKLETKRTIFVTNYKKKIKTVIELSFILIFTGWRLWLLGYC